MDNKPSVAISLKDKLPEEFLNAPVEKRGVVLYIDGSARPTNPGFIGSGVHGYFYVEAEDDKAKPAMAKDHLITGLGYIHPKNIKSTHKWVKPITYLDMAIPYPDIGTNNYAELSAFKLTLEGLRDVELKYIDFFTDSDYVSAGVTDRCRYYERNDWTDRNGAPIKNLKLWKDSWTLVQEFRASGKKLHVSWVKAHNGVLGNVQADALALIGLEFSRSRITEPKYYLSDAKNYWSPVIDMHPFFHHKHHYSNTSQELVQENRHYVADDGATGLVLGSRKPETGFCVIQMKEKIPAIEAVRNKNVSIYGDVNRICKIRLDNLFSKDVYPYVMNFGTQALTESKFKGTITSGENNVVSQIADPSGLTIRGLETFAFIDQLFERFLKHKDNPDMKGKDFDKLNWHDITDQVYDTEVKKVKGQEVTKLVLKPDFVVGKKALTFKITEEIDGKSKDLEIAVNLGSDLPPRNNLKNLETENPKIYLITWRESNVSLRFAFVIDCESGVGMWSNHYADKVFFNS